MFREPIPPTLSHPLEGAYELTGAPWAGGPVRGHCSPIRHLYGVEFSFPGYGNSPGKASAVLGWGCSPLGNGFGCANRLPCLFSAQYPPTPVPRGVGTMVCISPVSVRLGEGELPDVWSWGCLWGLRASLTNLQEAFCCSPSLPLPGDLSSAT